MPIKFTIIGLVIFMLPMLINIVYFVLPPVDASASQNMPTKWIEMVESISRIAYAVLICFMLKDKVVKWNSPLLYFALLFLVLYYVVWIRYFLGGRDVALMRASFCFIPMPLAVFPVLYFLLAALWLGNYPAAIIMVIFGIAHNIVSYQSL